MGRVVGLNQLSCKLMKIDSLDIFDILHDGYNCPIRHFFLNLALTILAILVIFGHVLFVSFLFLFFFLAGDLMLLHSCFLYLEEGHEMLRIFLDILLALPR